VHVAPISISSELIGVIRRHFIWREASDRAVRALAAYTHDRTFKPGESILSAGEPARSIYLLVDGAVRVFLPPRSGDGPEVTVKLFWAPTAFGEAETVIQAPHEETVQALTHARVLITPASKYFRIMRTETSVAFRQYIDLAQRFAISIRTARAANHDDLSDRVVALIISYVNHFGTPHEGGVLIDYVLTQDDIACQVGSNRRSIVRALRGLYKDGTLVRRGRRYYVPSIERLLATTRGTVPDCSYRAEENAWASPGV
jgi:CRP-like cAMP-binding protein